MKPGKRIRVKAKAVKQGIETNEQKGTNRKC